MRKNLLFACALTAAFVGCTNDVSEDLFVTCPVGGASVVIGADIEQMTRTSLSEPDGDGRAQVLWSDGDEIGVVTAGGTVRKAVIYKGAGTASAEFEVEGAAEGETYACAFYPYVYNGNTAAKNTVSGTTLSLVLPIFQSYAADGVFAPSTNTMVAETVGDRLVFRSIMGCLEIKLAGSQSVRGITVKNSVTKVAGKASFDLATKALTMGTTNESFSYAYLECPESVQLGSTPTSFYVLVPAGEYDCLQIGVLTDDGSYVRSATAPHTVKTATVLPLNCGNLDTMIDTSSAVDLSAAGYANCYIVSPDGGERVYSFETKFVDGTPVENPQIYGDDKSLAYFQLLWAEELGIAYDIRFDKAAGRVYFKYDGETVGNARIAGCNDFFASADISGGVKRARENVMWGWHIWATEAPAVGIVVDGNNVKDINGDGTITDEEVAQTAKIGMMDRSLGATWAPKSVGDIDNMTLEQASAATGCFYQFGNTHPYPRPERLDMTQAETGNWNFSAVKYRYGFSQYVQDWTSSGGSKTNVMTNAMYPMYRYSAAYVPSVTGSNDASAYSKQWLLADIIGGNSAKDEASKELCLWGGQGSKTNYDPCPAGWVVPHRGNVYQATIGAAKVINGTSNNVNRLYFHLGPQSGSTIFGSYLSYDGDKCDWFPFSGYMGTAAVGNMGSVGYFWGCGYYAESYKTSSTKLQYNMASYVRVLNNPNAAGYLQNGSTDTQCDFAVGYQVRCVKRN